MNTIYVGCKLTHAPESFIDFVESVKQHLRSADYTVLEPVGVEAGTDADVYQTDTGHVRDADLFVAICDRESIGLGMEIQLRIALQLPVLAVAAQESRITRMVTGAAQAESVCYVRRYTSASDIVASVRDFKH
jgi:nucleoside 2-deoxyribosyltransferase